MFKKLIKIIFFTIHLLFLNNQDNKTSDFSSFKAFIIYDFLLIY